MKQIGLWSLGQHWHWGMINSFFFFFWGGGRLRPKSCKSKIHKFYSAWLLLSLFCLKLSEDCSSCKTPKSKSQYVFLLLFPLSWTQIKLPFFFFHFFPCLFSGPIGFKLANILSSFLLASHSVAICSKHAGVLSRLFIRSISESEDLTVGCMIQKIHKICPFVMNFVSSCLSMDREKL